MVKHVVTSNATGLVAAVIERGLTATQAARAAKIARDTFDRLIRVDAPINFRTASKLKAAFGDNAIKINSTAQI